MKLSTQQRNAIKKGALLTAQIAAAKKELEALKAGLGLPEGEYQSGNAILLIGTSDRESLDTAIVKGFLTPAEIKKATKTTSVTTYRFKLVAQVETFTPAKAVA